MKIDRRTITVEDLCDDYIDQGSEGVFGYGGKLSVRPAFQREFVYSDKQRDAVINTVARGYPLNVMYWSDCGSDSYEVIDGQQRTISIARFVKGAFSCEHPTAGFSSFEGLSAGEKDKILSYELDVFVCSGDDREKLDWFKTINVAGAVLTPQELRNAVYTGPWLDDAKDYFSRPGCVASKAASDYVAGTPIRQQILETAISWAAGSKDSIEVYMDAHRSDPDASELWDHFESVIEWVQETFTEYRKPMRSVDWGPLWAVHGDDDLDPEKIEADTQRLFDDDDVQRPSGIYVYLLTGDERHLNLRAFSEKDKVSAYGRQKGDCTICKKHFAYDDMQGDHITPWSKGGSTTSDNCQMLCTECNQKKSNS